VLNPADEYVRTFVAHTNPLNVLSGYSLMRGLDKCGREGNEICLERSHDIWLALDNQTVKALRRGGESLALQRWTPGMPVTSLQRQPTLAPADIRMRDALEIRYHTGHKLVLETDGRAVGILGDKELYHALLGKNLEKAGEDVVPPAVRSTLSQAG
jgi:glycine betaine/proline transport system ATP-binding protein